MRQYINLFSAVVEAHEGLGVPVGSYKELPAGKPKQYSIRMQPDGSMPGALLGLNPAAVLQVMQVVGASKYCQPVFSFDDGIWRRIYQRVAVFSP